MRSAEQDVLLLPGVLTRWPAVGQWGWSTMTWTEWNGLVFEEAQSCYFLKRKRSYWNVGVVTLHAKTAPTHSDYCERSRDSSKVILLNKLERCATLLPPPPTQFRQNTKSAHWPNSIYNLCLLVSPVKNWTSHQIYSAVFPLTGSTYSRDQTSKLNSSNVLLF